MSPEEFTPGLRVRVVGAPDRHGSVVSAPNEMEGRWYVRVDFDEGARRSQPVETLERLPSQRHATTEVAAGRFEGPESLRRNLLHEKLHGRLSEVMYSMETSDTDFLAYQFKPIIKLLESPNNSLLIADEVGLGKTIEAGLIWTELKAREGASTLLVVCPPHLVTKWRNELKRRFGVDAHAVGPADLAAKLEECRRERGRGFALIATYHGLRPPKRWEEDPSSPAAQLAVKLNNWGDAEEPFLDLLIMDEAAIMRNETSQTSKLGGLLTPIARHKVYLSATPMHTREENLFNLLRRLDEDTFPDAQTFKGILEANAPLVALRDAILKGDESREKLLARVDEAASFRLLTGNRSLAELRARIAAETNVVDARIRAELAYQSERANLLAYVVTRTRRRDIETKPIFREVNTIKVSLTAAEQSLYHGVTEAVLDYALDRGAGAGFLTVMPQRQVASCMAAACERFNSVDAEDEELNPDVVWPEETPPGQRPPAGTRGAPQAGPLVRFLRESLGGRFDLEALRRHDSKYECLREAIRMHWAQHPRSKLVIFAYFKPTLRYLQQRLVQDDINSLLLTGDETGDKQSVVDAFAREDSPPVLLSSEVGSEGLDLQFASAMVNYDLPWNPMVVEQRIGRIHRIGQRAERIVVINLICEGTVDERIYDRLYERLDLFRRTLGDIEAVVGPVINALTTELLSLRLGPEQQNARIDRAATAVQMQMRLEEELALEAGVLAAYGDYLTNRIAASHQRGGWINGADVEAYVLTFFRRVFPATRILGVNHRDRAFEIELDPEAWHHFDEYLRTNNLRGKTSLATQERQQIRFDHRLFTKAGPLVEVVHHAHPLIRFIGNHLRLNRLVQPVAVAVEVQAADRPEAAKPGTYAFVSQRWTVEGLRTYETLHHELFSLDTQSAVTDETVASAIVEAAGASGRECTEVPSPSDPLLAKLGEHVDDLEFDGDGAFHRFLSASERENEDRKQIQLRGLERFEDRRRASLDEVAARHRSAGRKGLAAAAAAKIENLRKKTAAQRQKIERKLTSGNCSTIAAGFILIH